MQHNLTIRKKDNGYQVIVSYKDRLGKWRQKAKQGFQTQREAKLYADDIIAELKKQNQLTQDPYLKNITLQKLWELFIQDKERVVKPNTISAYETAFKRLSPLNDMPIADISSLLIESHINQLDGSPASINMVILVAKLMFAFAVKHRIIADTPLKHIAFRAKEKKDLHVISQQDMDVLFQHLKEKRKKMYLICLVARYTGMRVGEILGLTWSDIDIPNQFITVSKQWAKTGKYTFGMATLKSKNGYRRIPIPAVLISALCQFKKEEPRHISDRLFPYATISQRINLAIKEHIPHATIHDFRHTYATKLLSEGVDVKTVATLLGDTVETTIKTYIHYSEEMERKAKKDIERIFA